jgi:hypothetical protein
VAIDGKGAAQPDDRSRRREPRRRHRRGANEPPSQEMPRADAIDNVAPVAESSSESQRSRELAPVAATNEYTDVAPRADPASTAEPVPLEGEVQDKAQRMEDTNRPYRTLSTDLENMELPVLGTGWSRRRDHPGGRARYRPQIRHPGLRTGGHLTARRCQQRNPRRWRSDSKRISLPTTPARAFRSTRPSGLTHPILEPHQQRPACGRSTGGDDAQRAEEQDRHA